MKILGLVILAGFFGVLSLIFIVYVFKLLFQCREKLRLEAEYKKKDFEECVVKPSTENTTISVKVDPKTDPNPLSVDIVDSGLHEDADYDLASFSSNDNFKNETEEDDMIVHSTHRLALNNGILSIGSMLRLPRIELAPYELKSLKVPEVLFQIYSTDDIRRIQKDLWSMHKKSSTFSGVKDLGSNVIIAVCTLEKSIGGIYLNLEKRFCQQYSYAIECLPWEEKWGETQKDLEMKNLLFALLLWETEIVHAKLFRCYTGTENPSTCFSYDNFYGRQVTMFLEHLTECQDAILVDSNVMINRNESPKEFAQYIQPAEDLIMCKQELSEKHVKKIYGIKEFVSSHILQASKEGLDKNNYVPSSYYNFLLDTVYKRCRKWSDVFCPICHFTMTKK